MRKSIKLVENVIKHFLVRSILFIFLQLFVVRILSIFFHFILFFFRLKSYFLWFIHFSIEIKKNLYVPCKKIPFNNGRKCQISWTMSESNWSKCLNKIHLHATFNWHWIRFLVVKFKKCNWCAPSNSIQHCFVLICCRLAGLQWNIFIFILFNTNSIYEMYIIQILVLFYNRWI